MNVWLKKKVNVVGLASGILTRCVAMEIADLERISVRNTKSARVGKEMKEKMDNQTAINALEKQIAKEPITYKNTNLADCPICKATVRGIKNKFGDWCSGCGQKLDWSKEDGRTN